jgi:hypothetical protein
MDPRPRLGEPSRMTNTTEHTTDVTTTVDGYLAARNERDPERRGELIARVRARTAASSTRRWPACGWSLHHLAVKTRR